MAKVQKPLPGLAKFLGLETQGVIKLDAGETAVPVLEIDNYLSPTKWQWRTFSIAAVGNRAGFTVPQKRFWRLKWAGCKSTFGAGINGNFGICLNKTISGVDYQFMLSPLTNNNINLNAAWQNTPNIATGYGLPLIGVDGEPGDRIECILTSANGAGPWPGEFFVMYQELEL